MRTRLILSVSKTHRILAFFLVLLLGLSLLLGTAFVLAELHHHCTGEDCKICAAVAHTVSFLKAEMASLSLPIVFALLLLSAAFMSAKPNQAMPACASLVSLKVKLSD